MQTFSVIEKLYVAVQIRLYIFYCSIFSPQLQDLSCNWVNFFFERSEKTLHARIIIRASRFAHGAFDAVFRQHTFVCSATVLTSAVAVENKSLVSPSKSQGIGKRPLTKLAVDVFTHFISNHLFVFQIQDGNKIKPPHVGGDIGNISCPEFIKSIGQKVAFDLVFAIHTITFCLSVRLPFLPRLGIEAVLSHNSSNLPFADENTICLKGFLDFSTAVNFTVINKDSSDRFNKPYFTVLALLSVTLEADPLIVLALTDL